MLSNDSESEEEEAYRKLPKAENVGFASAEVKQVTYRSGANNNKRQILPSQKSVILGFAQEDQLIRDSEAQRNIDMSELKDLLS